MGRYAEEAAQLRLGHALGFNELGVLGVQTDGLPVQAHLQDHGFVGVSHPHVFALELPLQSRECFIGKRLFCAQYSAGDGAVCEQLAGMGIHCLTKP
ncbi:hypothetical protein D3C76_889660 [compost metagenome]